MTSSTDPRTDYTQQYPFFEDPLSEDDSSTSDESSTNDDSIHGSTGTSWPRDRVSAADYSTTENSRTSYSRTSLSRSSYIETYFPQRFSARRPPVKIVYDDASDESEPVTGAKSFANANFYGNNIDRATGYRFKGVRKARRQSNTDKSRSDGSTVSQATYKGDEATRPGGDPDLNSHHVLPETYSSLHYHSTETPSKAQTLAPFDEQSGAAYRADTDQRHWA